jgi:hypothetical protein
MPYTKCDNTILALETQFLYCKKPTLSCTDITPQCWNRTPAHCNLNPSRWNIIFTSHNPTPSHWNITPASHNPTPPRWNWTPLSRNPTPPRWNWTPLSRNPTLPCRIGILQCWNPIGREQIYHPGTARPPLDARPKCQDSVRQSALHWNHLHSQEILCREESGKGLASGCDIPPMFSHRPITETFHA